MKEYYAESAGCYSRNSRREREDTDIVILFFATYLGIRQVVVLDVLKAALTDVAALKRECIVRTTAKSTFVNHDKRLLS